MTSPGVAAKRAPIPAALIVATATAVSTVMSSEPKKFTVCAAPLPPADTAVWLREKPTVFVTEVAAAAVD